MGLELLHQAFIDLAREDHFDDIHRLLVGIAQASHKAGFLAELFQHGVDFGASPMHQHHPDADRGEKHNILHDRGLELVADHGVAAVFNDDGFACVLFDVGQGLGEDPGSVGSGNVHGKNPLYFKIGETSVMNRESCLCQLR